MLAPHGSVVPHILALVRANTDVLRRKVVVILSQRPLYRKRDRRAALRLPAALRRRFSLPLADLAAAVGGRAVAARSLLGLLRAWRYTKLSFPNIEMENPNWRYNLKFNHFKNIFRMDFFDFFFAVEDRENTERPKKIRILR